MQRIINNPTLFAKAVAQAQEVMKSPKSFQPNGHGRRFLRHCAVDSDFTQEVFASFGINTFFDEPIFGNLIGNHCLDGAFVHRHKDSAPSGYHHVRCNFALQLPTFGGNPILGTKELQIKRGDMWICFASIEDHATTPISGGQRLVFSCGAIVKSDVAEQIYKAIIRAQKN